MVRVRIPPRTVETSDMHLLLSIDVKLRVQINHSQFCFLIRLADTVTRILDEIESDAISIMTSTEASTDLLIVGVLVPEVEISMLFPGMKEFGSILSSPSDSEATNNYDSKSALDNLSPDAPDEDGPSIEVDDFILGWILYYITSFNDTSHPLHYTLHYLKTM